ncbi:MAG: replicative DNA helicase [Chlamydiota bacterium]
MTQKSKVHVKAAPNSKESEMMILGCMLTSINALNIAADSLEDSDFYYKEHQSIFNTLKAAYRNDKPADIHLVAEELKRQSKLEEIGGIAYLTTLAQYAGTSAYVEEYAKLIKNKSILRKMISAAESIERDALSEPSDVHSSLDQAQALLFKITQTANANQGTEIKDLLSGVKAESQLPYLKELQERQNRFHEKGAEDSGITGEPSHFSDVDKMINGLNPSHLIIVAARPAMGKTAFAINIAENVCFKNKTPVLIFSLEMGAEQLLHRIICSQAEVESDKIRTGSLTGVEYQRIVATVKKMQQHTMIIDDQPGLKVTDLRARARRMKEIYGIGLIIIDYLQLLSGSSTNSNGENRQGEISEISRMLKNLARELNIPIICASQLSRRVEERQGHRPMMSDLRESGCLAGDTLIQDALTGKLYTIKELAERSKQLPIDVLAVDHELNLRPYKMTKAFYSGKKIVYALITKTGKSIQASANHPFLTSDGWIKLEKLKQGDKIAIPSHCINTSSTHALSYSSHDRATQPQVQTLTSLLSTCEIYWDEILSITELSMVDVYDATVETVHNFVANGIVVHNSIEQDSDIIIFLLRREYYDPYDKPGHAEIIVAKNRHGQIGSVDMTYRKEFTQFANYTAKTSDEDAVDTAFSVFSPK